MHLSPLYPHGGSSAGGFPPIQSITLPSISLKLCAKQAKPHRNKVMILIQLEGYGEV